MSGIVAPDGLRGSRAKWDEITARWDLRPDELRVLEDACREMDLVDALAGKLADMPVTAVGSTGQLVVNPLVQEIRQHRTVTAALLKQLKLPEEDAERAQAAADSRSASARHAAKSRWTVHHGAA